MVNEKIFKAYDIRGIYPAELNEETAFLVGRALAEFTQSQEIMIGYDMRLSGPVLKKAFIDGLIKQGIKVWDMGQITTDASYWAAGKYNLPAVMITASHNPKEYNGFKFAAAGAKPIGEKTGLQEIKKLVQANKWPAKNPGAVEKKEILDEYIAHALSFIDRTKIKPFKIVVDAGNGMAGEIIPLAFKNLPCEIIPLYFELNGNFPYHQPSPIELKNVQDLIAKVKETKADLGLAFDGDADRVFFIDENGQRVPTNQVICLMLESILAGHQGEKVVYALTCSKIVPETIEALGGKPIEERVGHSFIKETMRQTKAIFGAEDSGHYYFRENYGVDSGLIAVLILLEILSQKNKPLSQLLKKYQKYYNLEETNIQVEDKQKVLKSLEEKFSDAREIKKKDGLTFIYADYWFNVRPSNTEPLLRLNLEAKSKELLQQKTEEILAAISR